MLEAFGVMKWALLACLILPWLLVYCGLHIVQREIIFVDLALAQVAAMGNCVAILLGHDAHDWQMYAWSVGFTVVGAAIFTLTRVQHHRVPQEALIGIVYVVAAAAGILLLSRSAEGNEELKRTLVGDVLIVQPHEILVTFGLYVLIGALHYLFRRQFLAISFEPQRAVTEGLAVAWWDFLFYVLFGFVVTSFVRIGGVLMIFSYLIVPAVCANFLTESLGARLAIGTATAALASMAGLYASYQFDLPSGAAIVVALGTALILAGIGSRLRRSSEKHQL
jgi:zinc/manganese transport system permease protein